MSAVRPIRSASRASPAAGCIASPSMAATSTAPRKWTGISATSSASSTSKIPRGRRVMLVADEDVVRLGPASPSFLWIVDITDETRPIPFASFQVEEEDGSLKQDYTGLHQFCEEVRSTEIPIAWFAHGLRIVDIANPHAPRETASFMPPVPEGATRVQSNDVCRSEEHTSE